MSENEKKTVKIKLERHLWPDEMRERQRRKQVTALMIASLAVVFIVGFLLGGTLHPVRFFRRCRRHGQSRQVCPGQAGFDLQHHEK